MNDVGTLTFSCPHCGGPLHVIENGHVACEERHKFKLSEVLLEQARTTSRSTWLAVRSLRERAETSRWAARDPELYGLASREELEASADEDTDTADLLQKQAQALDLTIWRMNQVAEGDGTLV